MLTKFKYGLPVWYGNISSIDDEVERAARLGFDYVEVSLDFPWPEVLGKEELRKILDAGRKGKVAFAFHAPPAGVEIGSPREELRRPAVLFLLELMRWTKRFSPLYFNLHGDAGGEETEAWGDETLQLAIVAAAARSCIELRKGAKKIGVVPTFENTPEPLFGFSGAVDLILRSSKMGFCFDVAHAGIINRFSREATGKDDRLFPAWARIYGRQIRAIHLHNIKGVIDHYPLFSRGRGALDLENAFRALRKTSARYVLIEVLKEAHGPVKNVSDSTFLKCLEMAKGWEGGRKK